jgi:hypothetical protein
MYIIRHFTQVGSSSQGSGSRLIWRQNTGRGPNRGDMMMMMMTTTTYYRVFKLSSGPDQSVSVAV